MKALFFNTGAVLFLLVTGLHNITAAENSILSNNLTLTQDSVYTHIENGKAITTFRVTASSSGNYSLRFWLMGVKHTDATYSSYAIRIDNNAISDSVTTDRGDWHLYQPDNTSSTYLTQGQHLIHLEGTLSDVPNAERVMTPEGNSLMNANTRYAKMKNHENYANYSNITEDPLETTFRGINYYSIGDNPTTPPFRFNAELNNVKGCVKVVA